MLGKTAGGLYWMFRYLERAENISRLVETGFRIAQTRPSENGNDWQSVAQTAGVDQAYRAKHDTFEAHTVIDFLLRDKGNPSSALSAIESARNNARLVRTALTREVWESVNNAWMTLKEALRRQVNERDLIHVLDLIRRETNMVRGALHGSMLRNDIYDFSRLGTYIERADYTARILDVKYYVLLPTVGHVGSSIDNVQWETILRAVSANRSFRWLNQGKMNAKDIAEFVIFDTRLPRSLAFSCNGLVENLEHLDADTKKDGPSLSAAKALRKNLETTGIDKVFKTGLHQFLDQFTTDIRQLSSTIEQEYRFYG